MRSFTIILLLGLLGTAHGLSAESGFDSAKWMQEFSADGTVHGREIRLLGLREASDADALGVLPQLLTYFETTPHTADEVAGYYAAYGNREIALDPTLMERMEVIAKPLLAGSDLLRDARATLLERQQMMQLLNSGQ